MASSKVWQVVIRGDKHPPQQAQRPRLSYWLVERRCWERVRQVCAGLNPPLLQQCA